jgi:hypothetical protein
MLSEEIGIITEDIGIHKTCRKCMNYFRVREKTWEVLSPQGFCIYGQLEGDFSLYYSTSRSNNCAAFILSEYNNETTKMESELNKKIDTFEYNTHDKRTKEYKLLENKLIRAKDLKVFKEFKNQEGPGSRWILMRMNNKIQKALKEMLRDIYEDDYKKLQSRKYLSKVQYLRILADLNSEFYNKYFPRLKVYNMEG